MKSFFYTIFFISFFLATHAQQPALVIKDGEKALLIDSNTKIKLAVADTAVEKHSPRTAAIRSAILPGWGQVYNKKAWKVPIVYAALGITGYIFVDNIKTYREYRFAYAARLKAQAMPNPDSTDYFTLEPLYKIVQPESIRAARNRFRQYIDYSVLFFFFFWGLNVVDAAVDAHLKSFDISPDLSLNLRLKPGYSDLSKTNGISLVLNLDKRTKKTTFTLR